MALYKQVKVSVEQTIAESFKIACMDAGVSMAAELSAFMAAKSSAQTELAAKATKKTSSVGVTSPCYDTRPKRRRHVKRILSQLEAIKDYEAAYRDNIPENLQAGPAYEAADRTVDNLEQVIELLNDTY